MQAQRRWTSRPRAGRALSKLPSGSTLLLTASTRVCQGFLDDKPRADYPGHATSGEDGLAFDLSTSSLMKYLGSCTRQRPRHTTSPPRRSVFPRTNHSPARQYHDVHTSSRSGERHVDYRKLGEQSISLSQHIVGHRGLQLRAQCTVTITGAGASTCDSA
jgi:hypothetical protein